MRNPLFHIPGTLHVFTNPLIPVKKPFFDLSISFSEVEKSLLKYLR